eukprot:597623-Pelagomonas_calceolata.AAC.1
MAVVHGKGGASLLPWLAAAAEGQGAPVTPMVLAAASAAAAAAAAATAEEKTAATSCVAKARGRVPGAVAAAVQRLVYSAQSLLVGVVVLHMMVLALVQGAWAAEDQVLVVAVLRGLHPIEVGALTGLGRAALVLVEVAMAWAVQLVGRLLLGQGWGWEPSAENWEELGGMPVGMPEDKALRPADGARPSPPASCPNPPPPPWPEAIQAEVLQAACELLPGQSMALTVYLFQTHAHTMKKC